MPSESVRTKAEMYRLLAAGAFGNTCPQYFSVREWWLSGDDVRYPLWGVRSQVPGGPCRLHCPADEVDRTVREFGCPVNISVMVDSIATVTLMADIWDSPTGLIVYGIEYPEHGASWRAIMPTHGRHWHGIAAKMLLAKHLNANSRNDLDEVFARYPGHIIEVSALDRCIGVKEHRNTVKWEVRGTY